MKHSLTTLLLLTLMYMSLSAQISSADSIIGRPLKEFSTTAFCSYNSFHPSQYIADNNWDILCAFRTPGPTSKLDSLNIPYNKSQLRFLMVGDLLSFSNGELKTKMKIFDNSQTIDIRSESKSFADSIFPVVQPQIKELISLFKDKGYSAQTYSLIFSYLLDGYIWTDNKLTSPSTMKDHGTWSGAYWAMYDKRNEDKIGTNGYGPVKVNWSDELGYWMRDKDLLSFANFIMDNGFPIEDDGLRVKLNEWGLVDTNGQPTVPVIYSGNKDNIDILCDDITTTLSDAVKRHCANFASKYDIDNQTEAEVIFYHEAMWDILSILETKDLIEKPAILKGEEVGKKHFADITFIVL